MLVDENKFLILIGILFCSGALTVYFTLYVFYYYLGIFCVTPGNFGELIWCSAPAGTFFPLPKESGGLTAITHRHSLIDYLLYVTLVSTNLIYFLPLILSGLTLFTAWTLFRLYRTAQKKIYYGSIDDN
ncbi:MAG: hypothetical protein ACXABU_05090 [Candidatus Hodarchaeales archaeon]|jgi:hypothetical protein